MDILKKYVSKRLEEVSQSYSLTDTDELMEYMWLKPNETGLKIDIFVDDNGSYKINNHSLLLFARNGYDKSVSEFISFLVSNNPIIMNSEIEYHISYNDIFAIQDFIQANVILLIKLATQTISQNEFVQQLKVPVYSITESKSNLIVEMATLRAKDSNLPVDIWLDEGATSQSHAPRVKFRASNEQHSTKEFSSMTITNPPEIFNFPDNSPLKKKDIDRIKKFVIDNTQLLLDLANGKIDYRTDFLNNVIL